VNERDERYREFDVITHLLWSMAGWGVVAILFIFAVLVAADG
jgi:hypothetical protein